MSMSVVCDYYYYYYKRQIYPAVSKASRTGYKIINYYKLH